MHFYSTSRWFTSSCSTFGGQTGMCLRALLLILILCTTVSMHYGWLRPLHKVQSKLTNKHNHFTMTTVSDYEQRFANVARLYASPSNPANDILQRLQNTHVCVIGLGGVGSWVAESLARNGITKLTLIDADDVCISNTNRQVMAQTSTIGKFKAECLKSRILDINPAADVHVVLDFVRPENALSLLTLRSTGATLHTSPDTTLHTSALLQRYDYVVDAVDSTSDKAAIIDACVCSNTPVVTCGGVGGLTDPTLLTISDIAQAEGDSLLYKVRRTLRREYGYPAHTEKEGCTDRTEGDSKINDCIEGGSTSIQHTKKSKLKRPRKWGILAVHTLPTGVSRTPTRSTHAVDNNGAEGSSEDSDACSVNSESSAGSGGMRTCDGSLGNACCVTATVGMMMSSCIVNAVGFGCGSDTGGEDSVMHRGKGAIRPRQLGRHFIKHVATHATSSHVNTHANPVLEAEGCHCGKLDVTTAQLCSESADTTAQQNRRQQEHSISTLIFNIHTAPLVPMFDAHCHLQLPPLHTHIPATLQLAHTHNITHISVCGTSPQDWHNVRMLYETYPNTVIPSFGLHPWSINTYLCDTDAGAAGGGTGSLITSSTAPATDWPAPLEQLLQQIPTAGVGECGLDKATKTHMDNSVQEHILHAHIALAVKYQRVLTLHCVAGCWDRLLHILTQYQKQQDAVNKKQHNSAAHSEESSTNAMPAAIILHSCNSLPLHLVPHFARLHNTYFSLSMGGTSVPVPVPGGTAAGYSEKIVALVKTIPPQRLLLETDSPDQLPSHLRMRVRNTSSATAITVGTAESVHPADAAAVVTANQQSATVSTTAGDGDGHTSTEQQLPPVLQYNEPAMLQYHCKKLSEALDVSYETLAAQTYDNTCRAYNVVQDKC